jgi:hypothetical protein
VTKCRRVNPALRAFVAAPAAWVEPGNGFPIGSHTRRKIFRRYIHQRMSHSTSSTAAPWISGS